MCYLKPCQKENKEKQGILSVVGTGIILFLRFARNC